MADHAEDKPNVPAEAGGQGESSEPTAHHADTGADSTGGGPMEMDQSHGAPVLEFKQPAGGHEPPVLHQEEIGGGEPGHPEPEMTHGADHVITQAAAQSIPTRQYLDQTVVPILLQALSALAKERYSLNH